MQYYTKSIEISQICVINKIMKEKQEIFITRNIF